MADQPIKNTLNPKDEDLPQPSSPDVTGGEESIRPPSDEELVKESKNKDIARIVDEVLRGKQIASVYIDTRSGGIFFGGEDNISGDVVHGKRKHRTDFTGPVTGPVHTGSGDIHYHNSEKGDIDISFGSVLREDLNKIIEVYITPKTYDQAEKVLSEKNVLILWGQAHWGKWTTALHLLSTIYDAKVNEIDPTVSLEDLCSHDLVSEQGYAIDTISSSSLQNLNTHLLNRLSRRMKEQKNHLVITVDSRVSLIKENLGIYLVLWSEIPDRAQLLDKHFTLYLSDQVLIAKAKELIKNDSIQELISTHLLPGEIDNLAELLVGVIRGESKLEDALARFKAHTQQQVANWFDKHVKLEERTFMMSVAVLNSGNYLDVAEADERLQSMIKPPSQEDKTPALDIVFGSPRSQRIKDVCAHTVRGYEETEFGRSPVELIELDNPTFQPVVLGYVWNEYDRLRGYLISWLRDMGLHSSFDVRTRAAAAIGELSKYNFSYIKREVFIPWANHQDNQVRASAAIALGIPAWDGEFAPQVLNLLHHWSTLRNNWRLAWTATAAYGGFVGLRFPDAALRDFYRIAQAEDLRLFGVLSRSVFNLFEAGQIVSDYYSKVLDALIAWSQNPKDKIVTLTALLIYLALAVESKVKAEPEGKDWPTLLYLARENESYRSRIVTVWRQALNTKAARKPALEALHYWLQTTDEDARLYPTLELVIRELASQGIDRERDRLIYYLGNWADDPKGKSETVTKILSALE